MNQLNVYGRPLKACCHSPLTGFYRDGHCHTGPEDHGIHTVCIRATPEFLAMSRYLGNNLSTPVPQYNFPGVRPGDGWCLCAERWLQAHQEGCAPPVDLEATHQRTLDIVPLELLEAHAWKGQA